MSDSAPAPGPIKSFLFSDKRTKDVPTPPPLPEYDNQKEPPMWSWGRIYWGLPVDKGPEGWPRVGHRPESDDKPDWRGVVRSNILPYPEPKPYEFGKATDTKYFWFDTPDYADPFKKMGYAFKFFGTISIGYASARGSFLFKYVTMKNNLLLFTRFAAPLFSAGIIGSAATIVTANLRGKKDDQLNYAVGGMAASTIYARYHYKHWFLSLIILVPLSMFFKYNAETNGRIFPVAVEKPGNHQYGYSADNGFASGDLRFGYRRLIHGDPGRDARPGGVI